MWVAVGVIYILLVCVPAYCVFRLGKEADHGR